MSISCLQFRNPMKKFGKGVTFGTSTEGHRNLTSLSRNSSIFRHEENELQNRMTASFYILSTIIERNPTFFWEDMLGQITIYFPYMARFYEYDNFLYFKLEKNNYLFIKTLFFINLLKRPNFLKLNNNLPPNFSK